MRTVNGHQIYTEEDFTKEEKARRNIVYVRVVLQGEIHCSCCGASFDMIKGITYAAMRSKKRLKKINRTRYVRRHNA